MSTAIEITAGIAERTSRVSLKKAMEQFGEVVGCHMGTRGVEAPIVRFQTQTAAENALEQLNNAQVFLDGCQLSGDWKGATQAAKDAEARQNGEKVGGSIGGGGSGQRGPDRGGGGGGGSRGSTRRDDATMEMTSRDFIVDRGGDRGRSRERRRDRSRSRGERRHKEKSRRSRSRSRSRGRRRDR